MIPPVSSEDGRRFLNQIIRPGEDTVLMIDWRLHADAGWRRNLLDLRVLVRTRHREPERLCPWGGFSTARGHHCQHRLNAHLLILHLPPQDAAEDLGRSRHK